MPNRNSALPPREHRVARKALGSVGQTAAHSAQFEIIEQPHISLPGHLPALTINVRNDNAQRNCLLFPRGSRGVIRGGVVLAQIAPRLDPSEKIPMPTIAQALRNNTLAATSARRPNFCRVFILLSIFSHRRLAEAHHFQGCVARPNGGARRFEFTFIVN